MNMPVRSADVTYHGIQDDEQVNATFSSRIFVEQSKTGPTERETAKTLRELAQGRGTGWSGLQFGWGYNGTGTSAAARAVAAGQAGGTPETFRLITTILDPDDVTAIELAAAYSQRWEYEISLREIETQMLEPGGGLRSKSPELVRQELWGLLLAHFAIRSLMAEAAASAGLDPDRLSFMRSTGLARRQVTDQAAFSPGRLGRARETAIAEILERVSKGRRKRA
jgi:IS4 transposase